MLLRRAYIGVMPSPFLSLSLSPTSHPSPPCTSAMIYCLTTGSKATGPTTYVLKPLKYNQNKPFLHHQLLGEGSMMTIRVSVENKASSEPEFSTIMHCAASPEFKAKVFLSPEAKKLVNM